MNIPTHIDGRDVLAHALIEGTDDAVVLLDETAPGAAYVTAIVNPSTLKFGEWALGHYFTSAADAQRDFIKRAFPELAGVMEGCW